MIDNAKEERIRTIRERMETKDTHELESILHDHDLNEWSPDAFTAIEQILEARSTGDNSSPRVSESRNSNAVLTPIKSYVGDKRYPALEIVISIYRVLAVLLGIIAVIALFVGLANKSILAGFGVLVICLISAITCIAAAESIKIFIDIENNTRRSADAMASRH